jgi:SAM-dependent methyltransferase
MKITEKPELGGYMTFELSKEKPIHGWFWYKEGFAPEIVEYALRRELETGGGKPGTLLDPFCGVGTTLLAAKQAGIESAGVDASPLAVFVSKTKTDDYDKSDLEAALDFLSKKPGPAPDVGWEFELFDPRAAFPKRNYNEILALRQAIEAQEPRPRNLLLLALLSILPQASIVLKDGGVLKIRKDKRALPAREIFKRKVKRMVRELESNRAFGHVPQVLLGDARALDLPGESVGLVVTSPPYLNNIDYSKIYGLELSLLHMSKAEAEAMRMRAVRSFIGRRMEVAQMPPEVGEVGYKIPIVGTYFRDMEQSIKEMFRVLGPGGSAYVVVSNSVIHETHVLVDEIFGEMAQRVGFSDVEIVVGAERIADVRPQKVRTRESVVIMRK